MKILIVEDDVDSGEALMYLLADFGYDVKLVMSPSLAAAASADFRPDVAILDIGMPVISGYELIDVLRAMPELHACRYFAVTAYGLPGLERRSVDAGFEHHLTKPLRVAHLLDCLEPHRAVTASAGHS